MNYQICLKLHRVNYNCQTTLIIQLISNNIKINILESRESSVSFLHPVVDPLRSRNNSPRSSLSGQGNHTPRSHTGRTHIKLPTIALPTFEGDTCSWLLFRDTFEALIVNNTALSNVQKFHYHIASLKNEAMYLISNL